MSSKKRKPEPKDYGYEEPTPFDRGGWEIEGGEEKYNEDLEKWKKEVGEEITPFAEGVWTIKGGREEIEADFEEWKKGMKVKLLFIDTETTGLPISMKEPYTNIENWPAILGIAWEMVEIILYSGVIANSKKKDFIIKVRDGIEATPEAVEINGITEAIQREKGVTIETMMYSLITAMKDADYVVAHNAEFDRNVIYAEMKRNSYAVPEGINWLCNKELAGNICKLPASDRQKKYLPNLDYKQPSLNELYKELFDKEVPGRELTHGASQDVKACRECFMELIKLEIIKIDSLINKQENGIQN